MKQFFYLIGLICWIGATTGQTVERRDLIETVQGTRVNWTQGIIQAQGIGAPPPRTINTPQARQLARASAEAQARENLLAGLKQIRIDNGSRVESFLNQNSRLNTELGLMVQQARITQQEFLSDGTVAITLQMSLYGGFAQLILPSEIQQIESIKPVVSGPPSPPALNSATVKAQAQVVYTGLVIDARGLPAKAVLSPRVLDEDGKEVYGSAFVSREFAVQNGMTGYTRNLKFARSNTRVDANPLVVKGLRTVGPTKCDIVISNPDASKLRSTSEHLSFLKKGRVMIVLD